MTEAILQSWTWEPRLTLCLALTAVLYVRGWRALHSVAPKRFPTWRLLAFLTGLATAWIAVASPLDAFAGLLLTAHMLQHFLLMAVAPPLLLLGAPTIPLLRGLPRRVAHDAVAPFLSWPVLQRVGRTLTHPVVAWLAMTVSMWAWHVPAAYQLALRSRGWHELEHACFFLAALLFWWPVVQPWPSRPQWPAWAMPIYLLAADLQNTALSAIFAFSDRVLYPVYAAAPRPLGGSALDDQVTAGVVMWVLGSFGFLGPAVALTLQYLAPRNIVAIRAGVDATGAARHPHRSQRASGVRVQPIRHRSFDLLAMPLVGAFLRARSGRRVLQGTMLLVAAIIVADGLCGPQMTPMNLAGVLPWTYWRGLVVIALLVAGNLFCTACPFMLPRELGRRLGLTQRRWPRPLRSKWLAVALLVLFFWAYEVFGLWDSPRWTASIILAYFLAAAVVDAFFRGASFCKYVCPIGQFHFVHSLVSPLEVAVRQPQICASCTTHDCLRGNSTQRGCELHLYLPRKSGNLDCTFCLDCIHACPHDNIGIGTVTPGTQLWSDRRRSSVGRFSQRPDLAALALVLVFAAFANAAAMVDPAATWRDQLVERLGMSSALPVTTGLFVLAVVVGPLVLVGIAVAGGRAAFGIGEPTRQLFCRFSLALVPLGLAMWSGHFLFHLLAGWHSGWPALQRALGDLGIAALGEPGWAMPSTGVGPGALLALELLLLDAGLLLTLYAGWRIARGSTPRPRAALGLLTPWASVAVALYASGVWVFLQPMQMRGMIH